jgi:hypothetical protein
VDEIESVMHEFGSAFAAGLTQPGSMQAVLWDCGHWSQTYLSDEGLFAYDPVVFETYPYGHVRRLSRNDGWVMFAPDCSGNDAIVDLSIPPGLPVEHVHIVAERFEPHRLAVTPTIAYVTLAGNTEPVSVAALAGLPNLVRLDSRRLPSQTSVPLP